MQYFLEKEVVRDPLETPQGPLWEQLGLVGWAVTQYRGYSPHCSQPRFEFWIWWSLCCTPFPTFVAASTILVIRGKNPPKYTLKRVEGQHFIIFKTKGTGNICVIAEFASQLLKSSLSVLWLEVTSRIVLFLCQPLPCTLFAIISSAISLTHPSAVATLCFPKPQTAAGAWREGPIMHLSMTIIS